VITLADGRTVAYAEGPVRENERRQPSRRDEETEPTPVAKVKDRTEPAPVESAPTPVPPRKAPTPWRKPPLPIRKKPARDHGEWPRWPLYVGVAAIVVVFIGGAWAFLANRSAQGRQEIPIAASLSAKDLWSEYDKDPAGANRKYGNSFVRVKGKISRIPTASRVPTLVLETPNATKWTIEFVFGKRDDLQGLSRGQEVVIQGECESRAARPDANLQINSCKIVPGS
jgi:hypothetical protein